MDSEPGMPALQRRGERRRRRPSRWRFEPHLAAINARLAERGLSVRVTCREGADAEALSCALMQVLQQTHDRDVFELLYRVNVDRIRCYCQLRLRGLPGDIDPEDLVEDTFLRIFQGCATFRTGPGSSFSGWSVVIAGNVLRQALRRRQRAPVQPLEADAGLAGAAFDPLRSAMDEELRVGTESSWPTFVALCAAALARLPARWRRVVELREGQGLTYAEIARRMDMKRGHVGVLIFRARQRILELVQAALAPYELEGAHRGAGHPCTGRRPGRQGAEA